ncbi:Mitochondrial distribution and morphology protein 12 [Leucoagaricus sp. SymC.cos]|nr:Mitochondrial distribution and morphology protein 12 [Leucoagaricus sp. SymC.cos]
MSIDLNWLKLDASLANHVVDLLNRQLDNTERPSFIGPVQVTSLDFGSNAPDVELIDMRDIYRDFLEDDDDEDRGPVKVTEGGVNGIGMEDEEGYEWVSRRAGVRQNSSGTMTHPITHVAGQPHEPTQEPPPPPNPHPNLQLHFHVNWQSNIRISLQTSLRINYPSPMFMSLPIRLSVTGLVFNGEFAVAYEGERKRVHLCILDDLDPYGPAGSRRVGAKNPLGYNPVTHSRPTKPVLPIGQRLLPSIFIESEIGQADKHVLKNVTRIEKFIQDVVRKTVEEELVFPNFHTLVME